MTHATYDENVAELISTLNERTYPDGETGWKIAEKLKAEGEKRADDYLLGIAYGAMTELLFLKDAAAHEVYEYAIRAIHYEESAHDSSSLCRSYNLLGIVDILQNAKIRAINDFMSSLENCDSAENVEHMKSVLYSNIAEIYRSLKDYETALAYIQKALPQLEKDVQSPHHMRNLISAYILAANLCLEARKDIEIAKTYCRKAEKILQKEPKDLPLDFVLLCAKLEYRENEKALLEEHLDSIQSRLARKETYGSGIETVMGFLDFLVEIQDQKRFDAAANMVNDHIDQLNSAYRVHFLRDCIENEICRKEMNKASEYALEYYKLSLKYGEENRAGELEAIKASVLMHDMRNENQKLRQEAETDSLTNLANRYQLNRVSDEMFEKAARNHTSLAVEILDIDSFKQYNDTYGHQQGDECLKKVADVLKNLAGESERIFAARYGGDEFILLYENMSDQQILERAESLRSQIEALNIPSPSGGCLTISQGIRNSVPKSGNKLWDYMYAADNALYSVKRQHKGEIMLLKQAVISKESLEKGKIA